MKRIVGNLFGFKGCYTTGVLGCWVLTRKEARHVLSHLLHALSEALANVVRLFTDPRPWW
jgi:hypothetical protein